MQETPEYRNNHLDRRSFLSTSAIAAATAASASLLTHHTQAHQSQPRARDGKPQKPAATLPIVIASGNGMKAVTRAMAELQQGADPVDAVVEGVTLVENDPNDMSVGYGGLPNENGIVQLDASVMHGPTHKAGAVGAIENIRNPARVALQVLRKTDHVMIVGQGAQEFALAQGFKKAEMLTDKARAAWVRWKANLNPNDDWLDTDQTVEKDPRQALAEKLNIPWSYGTINCSAVDANGDIGGVTTTSGLSFKIPSRVGDSPIVGAGMFVDNQVGAAGATGRGEAVIQSCGAFAVVQHMANGDDPTTACLKVLRWIADHTKRKMLLNSKGEPNFGLTFYAVRKDGVYGSACMRDGGTYCVHNGKEASKHRSEFLYPR